ncbi:hypothetical protein [Cerasicoccus arenae]|uniref:Uncharacterized protein n=1 Tax=Cerasicoccus arenae TaxID=424488 RepID=A0A8J3DCT9_9BACT|nr:hypothetical protein [Cerasicoccus arenae]MBK1859391.1 hypothetical protein [Cerasicoccus arenae]GHC10713.1 hypothetical protein GCM10007047_30040 [Cerasicoccus arenae]
MIRRAVVFFFLLTLATLAHGQRYDPGLIGRWKVEFQDPPERKIVEAQLASLNLGHLGSRLSLPTLDPLIITISRNKFLVQAESHLLEAYNCVLEPDSIVILDRQERLAVVPLEYNYTLEGNKLTLTGTLNKINNLPVKLELRRVMAIPTYVDGTRGWLTRQGFLDLGKLSMFRGNQVVIIQKDKQQVRYEIGQLSPLDQVSLHEPELVAPDRIQATYEMEEKRIASLPYPILSNNAAAANPMYFTKEYFFDEDAMNEGYLITIYNTPDGEITFRAHGTGGGTKQGDTDIRYMKDRKNQDRMVIWVADEEIYERTEEDMK